MSVVQLERETPDGAEFEVDAHGEVSDQPEEPEAQQAQDAAVASVVAMGWTPEEATALVCALWNLGILLYGPEWAADPRETIGWNASVAQLLDIYVPKGVGGMVQVGAGLLMIGNGIVMMAARRSEIIRRGPRPLWARKPETEQPAGPVTPAAPPRPRPADNGGRYEMPKDITPPPSNGDGLTGLGL